MFELPLIQESAKLRTGLAQWGSEFVATFVLLATIFGTLRWQAKAVPMMVGSISPPLIGLPRRPALLIQR